MSIKDDWESLNTVERCVYLSDDKQSFRKYLKEAQKKGYVTLEEYKKFSTQLNYMSWERFISWFSS